MKLTLQGVMNMGKKKDQTAFQDFFKNKNTQSFPTSSNGKGGALKGRNSQVINKSSVGVRGQSK